MSNDHGMIAGRLTLYLQSREARCSAGYYSIALAVRTIAFISAVMQNMFNGHLLELQNEALNTISGEDMVLF